MNRDISAVPLSKVVNDDTLLSGRRPQDCRIVVAMSGGVDSSVTAALLHERGYKVIGITLQLYDHGAALQKKGACCAGADIHDARRVAATIGIPHYVLDYENRFRADVMEVFADSYLRGETPIPCVLCNQTVKFRDLVKAAQDLSADALATGHYVRRVVGSAGPELHQARDASRDQSYFLFATRRDQLEYLRFPLGDLPKAEVRRLAHRFALPVAEKPDSQDICFVPNGNYVSVVERLRPGASQPGNIVHVDGRILGRHNGIIGFTVGQRRGLGVGGTHDPLYVIKVNPDTQEVVVGPQASLLVTSLDLVGFQDLLDLEDAKPRPVQCKVRSSQPCVAAQLIVHQEGRATLTFDQPLAGVAPGQAAVCYDGTRVLGGGWIKKTLPALSHLDVAV